MNDDHGRARRDRARHPSRREAFGPVGASLIAILGAQAVLLVGNRAWAVVDRAGSLRENFTDFEAPVRLERVYASREETTGLFGTGWGTAFDAALLPTNDGDISLRVPGGDSERFFQHPPAHQVGGCLVTRLDDPPPPQLLDGAQADRQAAWSRFWRTHRPGETFVSPTDRRSLLLLRAGGVDEVTSEGGAILRRFDLNGRLSMLSLAGFGPVEVTYDPAGRLAAVVADPKHFLRFLVNAGGRVQQINGSDGSRAEYRYDGADQDLVWAKDSKGKTFVYHYGADGRHELTGIDYPNGRREQIDYYPKPRYGFVSRLAHPDGSISEYGRDGEMKRLTYNEGGHHFLFEFKSNAPSHLVYRSAVGFADGKLFSELEGFGPWRSQDAGPIEWINRVMTEAADQMSKGLHEQLGPVREH